MASQLYSYIEASRTEGHSEDYIREITTYIRNIELLGLPVIFSTKHLAILLKIDYSELKNLIKKRSQYYKFFKIRKRTKGFRWIMCPTNRLKYIQNWVKKFILEKIEINNSAIAFRKDYSIKLGAERHVDKLLLLNIDFYKFFDSINEIRIFGMFKGFGYHGNLAVDLAKLMSVIPQDAYWNDIERDNVFDKKKIYKNMGILPQGSPSSPIISNIICRKLDSRILSACNKLGNIYSRFADDITISSDSCKILSFSTIEKIIEDEGFYINNAKTHYYRKHNRQIVTGLSVNKKVNVNKKYLSEIRRHLYYCRKYGPENHQDYLVSEKNTPRKSSYKDWLYGKICFVNSINKEKAEDLFEKFEQINWTL